MTRRHALALLALCTVLRVVSLVRPCMSDDEATYAVVGREMLHGRVLYRDVVDHKPPAIYLTNAATQAIGGPTGGMVLLHALLIAVVWATGLLLARIVRRHDPRGGAQAPLLAALLWCVFSTTMVDVDGLAANCELFMMLPLVASVAVFLDANEHARATGMIATGALVGVAALYKYQAGIQLPLYAGAWILAHRREPARAIAGLAALAVGVAIPIALVGAYLHAIGGLDAAWFWFRFNFSYIDAGSSKAALLVRLAVRGGFIVASSALLYVLGAIGAVRALRGPPFARFCLAWLAVSAAAVFVGGRFFGHYFHQLGAPLAVLAAPGAAALAARRRSWFVAACAIPAAAFLALGALHDPMMEAAGQPDPDYPAVVAWLDAHAAPDDAICIWGNSPVLYFDADRPLGCRFVFANYLTGLSPATATQTDPAIDSSANVVPEAWDMLDDDLRTRRPVFVIDGSPGDVGFYGKYPPAHFPRLARVLACDYDAAADVIGMRIYRRAAQSRCL
jgi:4-amino-4-deoxy-L-arabinose transferase-like glycosyltransferase